MHHWARQQLWSGSPRGGFEPIGSCGQAAQGVGFEPIDILGVKFRREGEGEEIELLPIALRIGRMGE